MNRLQKEEREEVKNKERKYNNKYSDRNNIHLFIHNNIEESKKKENNNMNLSSKENSTFFLV